MQVVAAGLSVAGSEAERSDALMMCAECRNLHRVVVLAQGRHADALAAAFYRVSTRIAAIREVDMERAADDLYEHQLTCPLALEQPTASASTSIPIISKIKSSVTR